MKINSIDKDIRSLLNSSFYIIPRFQRPYSWDKENVSDFWNDTIANREEDYFIGSFVVYKINQDTYGIVDGQQRITTITMLLCAIRDALIFNGFKDLAEGVHNLIERKNIDNKVYFVLQTETSFPYFQEYIQTKDKPTLTVNVKQEEKTIQTAYKVISKFISDSVNSIKQDPSIHEDLKLDEIKKRLITFRDSVINLKEIFVELDNEDDAYIIFETLNTRGKDLSSSDLVKNLLTRFLRPVNDGVDRVKITWGNILDIVENAPGEVSMDNYIQHYWLSSYEYTGAVKLYRSIRKNITRENANKFFQDLEKQSTIYRCLFEPAFREWTNQEKSIQNSIEAINLFRVRQPLPLLMAIIHQYDNKVLSMRETTSLLNAIECFIFKYTAVVTTQSTGGLSMMYSSWAIKTNQIKSEADKNILVQSIKAKFRELSPTFEEYKVSLANLLYTNTLSKEKKLVKYFLARFHENNNFGNTTDYEMMTIEHVFPQSKMDDSTYTKEVIGNLGNLLLVSQELNKLLDNKSYSSKKKVLKDSNVKVDSILQEEEAWNKDSIMRRFDYMAYESYHKLWKI